MAGGLAPRSNGLRASQWWRDPLVEIFLLVEVLLAALEAVLVIALGRGPVIVQLGWVEPAAESFKAMAAIGIVFLCLGGLAAW